MSRNDVAVVGGGPAAWATAAACAAVGLCTVLVTPQAEPSWPNTYSVWLDELEAVGLGETAAVSWPEVTVVGHRHHVLQRPYARIDNSRLAAHIAQRANTSGLTIIVGEAAGVTHGRHQSTLVLRSGRMVDSAVVVDGTGATTALLAQRRFSKARQIAYGFTAQLDGRPSDAGCVHMDGRQPSASNDGEPPSFLFAQELADGRWFLEETVLATRDPVTHAALSERLACRLRDHDLHATDITDEEFVSIPMGIAAPKVQRTVGVGAAGGAVHPATGYSLAASLANAAPLAQAIRSALDRRSTPEAVSAAAWAALWPQSQRRSRRLHQYGLTVLEQLAADEFRTFLDTFFELPAAHWQRYVRSDVTALELSTTMRLMFAAAPASLRRQLMTGNPLALRA